MEKVKSMSTMSFSDDKKNLLVAGIVERLSDVDPIVVNEVLKFKTKDLIKIVGEQNLLKKLKSIIGDKAYRTVQWRDTVRSAIKHITSEQLLSDNNEIEIFLAIWEYMVPFTDAFNHVEPILKSSLANRFPFLEQLRSFNLKDRNNVTSKFPEFLNEQLESFDGKSRIDEIVQFVNTIPDTEMSKMMNLRILKLLKLLPKNSGHKLASGAFDIVSRYADALTPELVVECLTTIIERTNFSTVINSSDIDFVCKSDELTLVIRIYEKICTGLFSSKATKYSCSMKQLLQFVLPNIDRKFQFFSNFFINHYINQLSDTPNLHSIDPILKLQLRSMRLFNEILNQTDHVNEITMEVFIRIISGLTSPFDAIRKTACDTIGVLFEKLDTSSKYSKILGSLLKKRESFQMNSEELSVAFYHIERKHKELVTELFRFVVRPESALILKASLLDMLKLINDTEHLKIVVNVALDILQNINTNQRIILDPHKSIIVHETINRFNQLTIASITTPGSCRIFFEKVLQLGNVFAHTDHKLQSISILMMKSGAFEGPNELLNRHQKIIIDAIVKSVLLYEEVRKHAIRIFRKTIKVDGKIELDILKKMVLVKSDEALCLTQTPEWKCGVILLQFLLQMDLENPHELMRQLLLVLQKCLKFDDQSVVEYTKQIVLRDILNCYNLMSRDVTISEIDFKIDLVVQCIRGTQDAQTHHDALQLIVKLSTMVPDAILHNVMDIFTFVGDTAVRRDDEYIYRLISNIIKSIVPILKENNVIQVLKVFSDTILDVPVHRRSILYQDLLKTLGPKEFLWKFLAILFETDIRKHKTAG